jgi:hypothetical protein
MACSTPGSMVSIQMSSNLLLQRTRYSGRCPLTRSAEHSLLGVPVSLILAALFAIGTAADASAAQPGCLSAAYGKTSDDAHFKVVLSAEWPHSRILKALDLDTRKAQLEKVQGPDGRMFMYKFSDASVIITYSASTVAVLLQREKRNSVTWILCSPSNDLPNQSFHRTPPAPLN